MKFLHLDTDFTPFGKTIAFEAFTFNGGEPHIKIKEVFHHLNNNLLSDKKPDEILITTRIRSFNDLGFLLVATDALRRMGIQKISLFLPYFPAARQDRVMVKGEALTVKIYADIINNTQYEAVFILDPHSEVTPALLHRVKVFDNHQLVKQAVLKETDYLLISPDGGALKKVYKLAKDLNGQPVIECSKMRDVKTGQLSGFKVFSDDLKGKTCVIVDDICDGGGTFLGLAKELKAKNAGKLILVVTHGIFSKGLDNLATVFDKIYCTDSFSSIAHESLTQLKIDHGLLSN
ncbi:MAG: ribose-phosphate diphosphokinase [Saprospiraceae bacterium]